MNGALQSIDVELIQEFSNIYGQLDKLSDFQKSINGRMINLNYATKTIDVIMSILIVTVDNLGMEKYFQNK